MSLKRRLFKTNATLPECDIDLKINWDLESVLDAISNGEYEILGCRIIKALESDMQH